MVELAGTRSRCYFPINRLRRNALPDADFRYFSKASASSLDSKEPYHITVHGLYFAVWGDCPELCALRRFFKSLVEPK